MTEFSRALKTIEMHHSAEGPVVVLPQEDGQPNHAPFPLPQLPWSTMNWLGALGARIWHEHEVCSALLLLINPERQCFGVLTPKQSPRRDGVSWQLEDNLPASDSPEIPRYVGGSYQMALADDPEQALSLIPKADGLHLVHPVGMEPAGAWVYLRVAGELAMQNPNDVIFDDWSARCTQVMRALGLTS